MTIQSLSQEEKIKRGAEDSGQYLRYMMDFVGFTDADVQAVKDSGLIIEKHLPNIVTDFYTNLLRYPPTRKHFLKKDGTVDQDYLQKRMHHLTNFWRRTATGVFDEDYARYVDYVGRAHTSHGADPNIYIAERYVIGQVGFMQHAISNALSEELHEYDPDLEKRSVRAWNLLMMVILELLSRAYSDEHTVEPGEQGALLKINTEPMHQLAVDTYERGLGLGRLPQYEEFAVASVDEIPEGERKIVMIGDLSIGVFHHKGQWVAIRNHCLHRGGPVATGRIEGDTLICPWHGYQYDLTTGQQVNDPSTKLDLYKVTIRENKVYLNIPSVEKPLRVGSLFETIQASSEDAKETKPSLPENEFYIKDIPVGKIRLVRVNRTEVAVYNVAGTFYATCNACTHAEGPLSEGELDGKQVICPLHGSCFDVTTGAVTCGPADQPIETFQVKIEGDIGRVEPNEL